MWNRPFCMQNRWSAWSSVKLGSVLWAPHYHINQTKDWSKKSRRFTSQWRSSKTHWLTRKNNWSRTLIKFTQNSKNQINKFSPRKSNSMKGNLLWLSCSMNFRVSLLKETMLSMKDFGGQSFTSCISHSFRPVIWPFTKARTLKRRFTSDITSLS
jgi:hypothetical protein